MSSNEKTNLFRQGKGSAELSIREASIDDVEVLAAMMREAAEVMVHAGVEQWKPDMFTSDTVRGYFDNRRLFLLTADGQPAGLFTLQDSDPSYWKDLNDDRYLYLHRLTVRPEYRGLDYGGVMLNYAEQEAARQGKLGLRLDCVAHLPTLNAYYQRNGFVFVTERDLNRERGGRYVNLYEKPNGN
ncbi:GNAT family N-acetyltransferase [Saccharibacillus kuerlensis]|uniref:N-acetyltransferase YesJ n=1 Tax=Saccharibacillus kuerlensis TaxID=459527 RepID=A0ABQ2LA40_9BACL|nr:GNAT family N-acetyltransferase [Saccharibacillus kuerlensis]GGO07132.1 putative N-acetyltransferase YesJ [Saccharibacillus kuerlensis]